MSEVTGSLPRGNDALCSVQRQNCHAALLVESQSEVRGAFSAQPEVGDVAGTLRMPLTGFGMFLGDFAGVNLKLEEPTVLQPS
jgi:hypothetical protein